MLVVLAITVELEPGRPKARVHRRGVEEVPKVTYTAHNGVDTIVDGVLGDSLMRTAVLNGVAGIVGECGGVLSCATCHVYLDPADVDRLGPMGEIEDEMLDGAADERREVSRLSCQIILTPDLGDIHVTTPQYQE